MTGVLCWQYKKLLGKGSVKSVYKAFDSDEGVDVAWNQVRAPSRRMRPCCRVAPPAASEAASRRHRAQ